MGPCQNLKFNKQQIIKQKITEKLNIRLAVWGLQDQDTRRKVIYLVLSDPPETRKSKPINQQT